MSDEVERLKAEIRHALAATPPPDPGDLRTSRWKDRAVWQGNEAVEARPEWRFTADPARSVERA